MKPARQSADVLDLVQRQTIFDNTWTLATVLAAVSTLFSWYFGLTQADIGPVVWTLAGLAIAQFALRSALWSQLIGILAMGVAWHLDGGLQHPTLILLVMLPICAGALILNFWQQQAAMAMLLTVLASGLLLSSDTNSFIEEHYGLSLVSPTLLPAWFPRSRTAFADVTTSPTYNLVFAGTIALVAIALSATSRHIVALSGRFIDRARALQEDVDRAQELTTQLVTKAPGSEVLVAAGSGRILHASDQFNTLFGFDTPADGRFLLDAVKFAYPDVISRLIATGGDEIQGATIRGREAVLRVRARVMDVGPSPVVRVSVESCAEICWRGTVDSLHQPVFAINSRGDVVFLNRSAIAAFGPDADGAAAEALFALAPQQARWWDIAPLESARRVLDLGGKRYLASIRRERVAASIGELSFVHLHERDEVDAVAVA